MPGGFHGCWTDLTWIGGEYLSAHPGFTAIISTLLQPVGFAKFACPIVFFTLGICADSSSSGNSGLAPAACLIAGGWHATMDGDFSPPDAGGWSRNRFASRPAISLWPPWQTSRAAVRGSGSSWPGSRSATASWRAMISARFSASSSRFSCCCSNHGDVEDGQPTVARRFSLGFLRLGIVVIFAGFYISGADG